MRHPDCCVARACVMSEINRRLLDVDIPSQPEVLVKLSLLSPRTTSTCMRSAP
jgi:hypothetical protein